MNTEINFTRPFNDVATTRKKARVLLGYAHLGARLDRRRANRSACYVREGVGSCGGGLALNALHTRANDSRNPAHFDRWKVPEIRIQSVSRLNSV